MNTDLTCLILLPSHKHKAKIAPGHPKSKFLTCILLYSSNIKIYRIKVTKTGGGRLYHTVSYTPSLRSREGEGGEFVEKVILFGAISSYTEGLIT